MKEQPTDPKPSPRRALVANLAIVAGLAVLVASSFYVGMHAGRTEERKTLESSASSELPQERPRATARNWTPAGFTDRYAGSPFGKPEHSPYKHDLRAVRHVTDDGLLVLSTVDEHGGLNTSIGYAVLSGVVLPDLPDSSAQCRTDALDALRRILETSENRVYIRTVSVPYIGVPSSTSIVEVWTVEPGTGRADVLVNQELVEQGWALVDPENRDGDWRRLAEAGRTAQPQPCLRR